MKKHPSMIPPASAPSQSCVSGQVWGRDVAQDPLGSECWRPEMQRLRGPLLVLWVDVDQQVAPQVAVACYLQDWGHLGFSSSSVYAVARAGQDRLTWE
eukprot:9494296-Pyramimonas_sp.AAC.1